MNIKISKATLTAILVAILALAAYWYWSPYLVIRQMQSAAKSGDADAFNDHVDYPKLRGSLKGQFSAMIADSVQASSESKNPFAALGSMLGLAMVDKMVDAMVRPELVMQGMKNGQFGPGAQQTDSQPPTPSDAQPTNDGKVRWAYDRKGTDKLVAYVQDDSAAEGKQVGIVFERSGFANWKLTELRMPSLKP